MLAAGATFVARGYPVKLDHLSDLFTRAIRHRGCSIFDVLQPCVSFNNTYESYNKLVMELDAVPGTWEESLGAARRTDRLLIGVLRDAEQTPFHEALLGDRVPAEKRASPSRRMKAIRKVLV